LIVRPQQPGDEAAIGRVTELAFGRPEEAQLVTLLTPVISLVAEDEGGEVVGHVLLSEVQLEGRPVLQLGPLSVHPDRQRQGIGSALTVAALTAAEQQSEPLVLLVGHPEYYPRFGFEPARKLGIEPPIEVADEVWMVKRLAAYERHHRGRVTWPPAWHAV
jgi:putative acetyltransferase